MAPRPRGASASERGTARAWDLTNMQFAARRSGARCALQGLAGHTWATVPLVLSLLLASCASVDRVAATDAPTFIVVRHAEKADDGSQDPPLNPAGHARAQRLAALLRNTPLRAVYATAYRRTQATAAPAAASGGVPVITYDAKQAAAEFAQRLRRDHADGTVLVVAHSNTAPAIAAALCQCAVAPMDDAEYDRHMVIRLDARGQATLQEGRY